MYVFKEDVLFFRNMPWNAVSLKQMSYSATSRRERDVKEMRGYGKKMSYQSTADVHFTQKRAELVSIEYLIVRSFVDHTQFPEKWLEKAGHPGTYDRI